MSYHIYTTKGIILSERPIGESDRIYSILTHDLGLLRARAIGVRKNDSKLRGNLEPFAIASVSLVRGKEYWRLTSAEFIKRINSTPELARPLGLLEILIQGEEPHQELYDAVEGALNSGELTLVSQIMHKLGYLRESDLNLDKKELIKAINHGLQESHLI